ncbi:translocation/assembly module TamB domain-containing protein [Flammeovirga aprica]|uniref:T9SS type A sorting domain-containing protein n=1 Tax=Flammeovirga aprica JL-4 TaxID=694437 RepID=A0A7X9P3U8_9BACT|nr:hypothetical protein [Flammeovirga aprica]NME68309.1 hypothetical protein [Flammeovirga aprica JL-4]
MMNLTNTTKLNSFFLLLFLIISINTYSSTTYKLERNVKFDTYAEWQNYTWNESGFPTSADNLELNEYTIEINFDFPDNLNGISFLNTSWDGSGTNIIISSNVKVNFTPGTPLNLTVKNNGSFEILNAVAQPSQVSRIVVEDGGELIVRGALSYNQSGTFLDITGDVVIHGDLTLSNSSTSVIVNDTGSLTVYGSVNFNNASPNFDIGGSVIIQNDLYFANSGVIVEVFKTGTLEIQGTVSHTNWDLTFEVCGEMIVSKNVNLNGGITIDVTCDCANFDEAACECVGEPSHEFGRLEINGAFDFNCNNSNNIIGACNVTVGGGCTSCSEDLDLCKNVIDLPVTLLYFKGEKTAEGNLLSWKTGTEQNTSHFDVEVSNDKRNWSVQGTVMAAGNSNVPLIYNFLDTKMTHKYYRLAQYDLDHSVNYYGVVSMNNDGVDFNVTIYPTEISNGQELSVQLSGVNISAPVVGTFYTSDGKVLGTEEISSGEEGLFTKSILMPECPEGIVLLKIVNGKNSITKKILVH